ncbi:hypothetical protein Emag_005955 [Eimeria magna]
MGSAASSAGGPAEKTAALPENEWVLENVLFFDPQGQKPSGGGGAALANYTGPTVKRFTPSRAKLRNRNFRVFFVIEGRRQEFLLKLLNDPTCRILLCDRAGRELKEILTSHIKYMQRQEVSAEVYVRTEAGETASLAFEFESPQEAELFGEFVKTLFGIQVHFFGAKKIAKATPLEFREHSQASDHSDGGFDSDEAQTTDLAARRKQKALALEARTGCPLHGNHACRCAIERPNLDFLRKAKQESDSSGEEQEEAEINARHAARFPVAIDGPCEAGREVRLKDLAARTNSRMAARVVEWFVASQQGKDPTFPNNCEGVGQAFRLEQRHVGRYIQVRASRRLECSDRSPFVYSLSMKGPVTVDDATARAMLIIFGKTEASFEVTTKAPDLQRLFGLSPSAVNTGQPFFDMTLTITRQNLQIAASLPSMEAPLVLQMAYSAFFVSLIPQEELDEREEDLRLRLHFPSYNRRKNAFEVVVAELSMPSEEARRHVYHVICFYRLQGKKGSFDRWARDLERSDFAFLKNKYSRMWAETTWTAFSSIAGTGGQDATARNGYGQQLLAEYQQEAGAAGYMTDQPYPPM